MEHFGHEDCYEATTFRGLIQLMRDWKCSLVKRDCNQVANALALLAR